MEDARRQIETIAQVVGWILVVSSAAAAIWAFAYASVPTKAPSYALESTVVLRAEMAFALTAAAAIPLLMIGRLLGGHFPDRISPQGAEWHEANAGLVDRVSELRETTYELDEAVEDALDTLRDHERRLAKAEL